MDANELADKLSNENFCPSVKTCIEAAAELRRLKALEKDAMRWVEFCQTWPICYLGTDYHDKKSLDAAVDAAMENK